MKRLNKRLERLEIASRVDADRGKGGERFINPMMLEKAFEFWQLQRMKSNLPASRDIFEAERAKEEAEWEAHVAALPANERPTDRNQEMTLRVQLWESKRRLAWFKDRKP